MRFNPISAISCPIIVCLSLVGCQQVDDAHIDPTPRIHSCSADKLAHMVGKSFAAFDQASLSDTVWLRVIHPGDAVTMDLRPERTNIEVDKDGIIAQISCY